jgi:hypothetical protein
MCLRTERLLLISRCAISLLFIPLLRFIYVPLSLRVLALAANSRGWPLILTGDPYWKIELGLTGVFKLVGADGSGQLNVRLGCVIPMSDGVGNSLPRFRGEGDTWQRFFRSAIALETN